MINKLLGAIIKVFLSILRTILNVILAPLTLLISQLFPDITDYLNYFYSLYNGYLVKGLKFGREVFFNLSGLNRDLVGIIALIPLTYLTFTILNASVRLLVSIWRIWKTGKTD